MVTRKYGKDIEAEAKRKLISEAYQKAIDEQNLDVVGYPDIEEIQFGRGQPLQFAATIETAPEFELPEYKGIPIKLEAREVTEADIEKALDKLRQSQAAFKTVERPALNGDIAVVSYTGSCEGKPILEIAPTAKGLAEPKAFWVEIGANSFIPGGEGRGFEIFQVRLGPHPPKKLELPKPFKD